MGIESVDMDRALASETYAAQCIRSGKLSGSQRGQLAAKWGADKIKLWESVDSTQYKIEDEDWNAAKAAGKDKAKEKTGYSGKKSFASIGDAGMAAASATGAIMASSKSGGAIGNWLGNKFGTKKTGDITNETNKGQKRLGARATVIMAAATAAKYWLQKPNKDQYEAAMELYDAKEGSGGLLIDGQYSLEDAQAMMEEATEETTALTEEANEVNEDANEDIEDDKTNFDFFRKQYEYLKAKAQSGEQLTPDEKTLVNKLTPLMEEAKTNIESTQENAATDLDDKYSEIENYEGQYDEGAETIAEVQGLTDFAEGFDSTTKAMTLVEGISQSVNAISATRAAALLSASGFWNIAFAAIGYAAAAGSGLAASQQFQWMSHISQEIDVREATQDLGVETEDVYNEELDNFTGNMDIIDDMEIAVPEDLNMPDQPVDSGESGKNTVNPLTATTADIKNDKENDAPAAFGADSADGEVKKDADEKDKPLK